MDDDRRTVPRRAAAAGREHRRERSCDDEHEDGGEDGPPPAEDRLAADAERLLGGGDELRARAIPVVGILCHRLPKHGVERDGQLRVGRARRRWLLLEVRPGDGKPRVADEGRPPRQALEEEAPEGVHVCATVDRAAFDLLGRQVRGGAERATVTGLCALLPEAACEPEVGEVHVLVRVEQHVRGLHVAVHEALRVRSVECVRYLAADRHRSRVVERAVGAKQRA